MRTLSLLITMFFIVVVSVFGQDDSGYVKRVYQFDIKTEINPAAWRHTSKALKEAKKQEVDLIVIHMNTYGGTLNDADSIRTALLNTTIPVVVFIDNNAASAGALISIACDSIYMNKGASIGASTVVDQNGEVLPDKYQSYMRSMMRSTAEAQGRDPQIAQAMVDPTIIVPNVIDSTKVLTFSTSEAIENGFCEGEVNSLTEVISRCIKSEQVEVITQTLTPLDKIISFMINPMVSGLLIMLIIGGLYFELQSPGVGFPLLASVVAAILYFSPLYLEGVAAYWEIALFIVGIILIIIELIAFPGFGFAGILGAVFSITGLTLAMVSHISFEDGLISYAEISSALVIVSLSALFGVIIAIYLAKKLLSSRLPFLGRLALESVQDAADGFSIAEHNYEVLIGKTVRTYTDLRPAGKILVDNEMYDACATDSFIPKGSTVRVEYYQNGQLFVTLLEE